MKCRTNHLRALEAFLFGFVLMSSNGLNADEPLVSTPEHTASASQCGYPVEFDVATMHNGDNPFDVNLSMVASPLDALLIISEMELRSVTDEETGCFLPSTFDTPLPFFLDVSGDGLVSEVDANMVIENLSEVPPVVSSVATVPEPSSVALMILAGIGQLFRFRLRGSSRAS